MIERNVTFTITLPVSASFGDTIAALKVARDAKVRTSDMDAAQVLNTVYVLADAGLSVISMGAAPIIPIGAKRS